MFRRRILPTLGSLLLATPVPSAMGAEEQRPAIERLAWLAGCWQRELADGLLEEQWMRPRGGTMVGMSRTTRDGETAAHEFLRIEQRPTGLAYVALPSGQTETVFVQLELTDTSVVFANPGHDFPQRIRYRILADGSMLARIEGERNGESRVVDFPMERVDCAIGPAVDGSATSPASGATTTSPKSR